VKVISIVTFILSLHPVFASLLCIRWLQRTSLTWTSTLQVSIVISTQFNLGYPKNLSSSVASTLDFQHRTFYFEWVLTLFSNYQEIDPSLDSVFSFSFSIFTAILHTLITRRMPLFSSFIFNKSGGQYTDYFYKFLYYIILTFHPHTLLWPLCSYCFTDLGILTFHVCDLPHLSLFR
jgi:hypothetical protein